MELGTQASGGRNVAGILSTIGGAAALIVSGLLLIGFINLFTAGAQPVLLPDNFVVLIIKLHGGVEGVPVEALDGCSPVDVAILGLVGTVMLALYPALKRVSRGWAIAAAALPWVGLAMYLITQGVGRSGMLAAGLIGAALMVRSEVFGKRTGLLGLLASVLLLAGDVGTGFAYATPFAIVMGIGYVLLLPWWILVGFKLLRLGRG